MLETAGMRLDSVHMLSAWSGLICAYYARDRSARELSEGLGLRRFVSVQARGIKVLDTGKRPTHNETMLRGTISWVSVRGGQLEEGEDVLTCTLRRKSGWLPASDANMWKGAAILAHEGKLPGWEVCEMLPLHSTSRVVGSAAGAVGRDILVHALSGAIFGPAEGSGFLDEDFSPGSARFVLGAPSPR